MANNTARAGFILPTTLEPRAIGPINSNFTRGDELLGAFLINDGASIPDAQAIDGMIVKEKTSGKMWVLQKNVGGTFDKVYIRYPYHFQAKTTAPGNALSGTPLAYGFTTYDGANAVNSSSAELTGAQEWQAPIKGLYSMVILHQWAPNANGYRTLQMRLNGASTNLLEYDAVAYSNGVAEVRNRLVFSRLFNAGDTVGAFGTQNSGVTLQITYSFISATMIQPVA